MYSSYKMRKSVALWEKSEMIRYYGLVIVDSVDWKTGVKEFIGGNDHLNNWVAGIAVRYRCEVDNVRAVLQMMINDDLASLEGITLTLRGYE